MISNALSRPRGRCLTRHRLWICFVFALWIAACSESQENLGDGQLHDMGWPSYFPRYQITLESLPIQGEQSRRYVLHDVPKTCYSLFLFVHDSDGELIRNAQEWDRTGRQLDHADVTIRARVTEVLDEKRSSEHSGRVFSEWWPAAMGGWLFKTDNLAEMTLHGSVVIEVGLSAQVPDALESPLFIRPVLVGGGFEV